MQGLDKWMSVAAYALLVSLSVYLCVCMPGSQSVGPYVCQDACMQTKITSICLHLLCVPRTGR